MRRKFTEDWTRSSGDMLAERHAHTQRDARPNTPLWRLLTRSDVKIELRLLLLQPFNGLFSRPTWVSRYQKGKTNLDFTGARDSEWQWHQLGHMQVCTLLQTDNHASTPPLFFTGRMPFLPPNQQRQSTEGARKVKTVWT